MSYVDPEFPHDDRSIQLPDGGEEEVEWRRASEFGDKLWDTIEIKDLCQGGLGDCWLIASIAAVAEFPHNLTSLFETKGIPADGRYVIRLFDWRAKTWRRITIDEYVPCKPETAFTYAQPLFCQPTKGKEIWCMLLEKAAAKLEGCYGKLVGGQEPYGWRMLTGGEDLCAYERNEQPDGSSLWHYLELRNDWPGEGAPPQNSFFFIPKCQFEGQEGYVPKQTNAQMWTNIRQFDAANFVMACSVHSGNESEHKRSDGLIEGHAYSLIRAVEFPRDGLRLVQLRNPWANGEWLGEWSDSSAQWEQYPHIAEAVGKEVEEDGLFWMTWDDFADIFTDVSVCKKSMQVNPQNPSAKRPVANVLPPEGWVPPAKVKASWCC